MTERSTVRAMSGVQLMDGKRAKDLMLGVSESIDQLDMENSVHCSCVEERGRLCLEGISV